MHGKQRVKGSPVSSLISLVAETSYCLHLSRLESCALVWSRESADTHMVLLSIAWSPI